MRSPKSTHLIVTAAVVVAAVGLVGCSSAVPTDTPGVDQLGRYILRQKEPDIEAVLGFRFAANNPGAEWLILELAISAPTGQTATVKRDNVFVRTPDGNRIPLATQAEFGEVYGQLRSTITKAEVQRDPMDYFPPSAQPCSLELFAPPGAAVTFDEISVNYRRACQGRLYFRVPGGVQQGRWVFGIDLPETEIRIPFQL